VLVSFHKTPLDDSKALLTPILGYTRPLARSSGVTSLGICGGGWQRSARSARARCGQAMRGVVRALLWAFLRVLLAAARQVAQPNPNPNPNPPHPSPLQQPP